MPLTRGQIIAEGLSQAGRSDLTSNARLWLNMFLERMYDEQDWKWLLKTSDGLSCTQGASFPADYRALFNATLGTNKTPLETVEADQWDALRQGNPGQGTPTKIYEDHVQNVFYFHVPPVSGLTFNIQYYYMPTLPDHTSAGTDSQTPVWGLADYLLIQAVYVRALEYNDDTRFKEEEMKLEAMIARAKMNNMHKRAGSAKFKMGKSFKKRF